MTFLTWKSPKLTIRVMTLAALLISLNVVLDKISIGSDNLLKISLSFIGTALIGYFLGPWLGGIAMVLADLISNTILATAGNFFFGFTFSAFISGVIAGIFLYDQKISLGRAFIYEFIQILITNAIFTTLWINLLYHTPFDKLLLVRMPKELISWPIESIVVFLVLTAIKKTNLKLTNANRY